MESTAINTVYVLIHIIEECKEIFDICEEGRVWEVYFEECKAKKEAKYLNEKFGMIEKPSPKGFYNKWIVLEKSIL